jgi:hypothetical protein
VDKPKKYPQNFHCPQNHNLENIEKPKYFAGYKDSAAIKNIHSPVDKCGVFLQ